MTTATPARLVSKACEAGSHFYCQGHIGARSRACECGCVAHPADLAANQVNVTADRMGREVIVVPDIIANSLRRQQAYGWTECRGLAHGYSREFRPGSWMHTTLATIVEAYAASAIPGWVSGADRVYAERERRHAAAYRHVTALIVGESGWDPSAQWWRDYDNTRHLHIGGSIYHRGNDAAGTGCYRFEG